eukprot:CAMPEP_0206426196 /NCGR_PEP_ID=MMETSP0324_2-20121206/4229_1 /ASSEMBLY_ACC=CAM_ASM_000836 /TAXON_ID=2866 /ORGANISM="Crypthecodinium cohnii, Strain Seligo" /LENGTH=76 /DNA_ID=CAMNT_0053891095 /DNA_START=102 /DNA_END=328 /DNA_ORIENTATION=-
MSAQREMERFRSIVESMLTTQSRRGWKGLSSEFPKCAYHKGNRHCTYAANIFNVARPSAGRRALSSLTATAATATA